MAFKSETHLYQAVTRAFTELEAILRDHPKLGNLLDGECKYSSRRLYEKQFHLLGEEHFSKKTVDYIHQNLASQIECAPQTWLVLCEDVGEIVEDPVDHPTHFYIQELAKLFRLPLEEPLADLYAPDTREYITREARISKMDIDRLILTGIMNLKTTEDVTRDFPRFVRRLAENLHKPVGYTLRLLRMGPHEELEFGESVGNHWNQYSRERMHQVVEKYPNRSNVLVVVGGNHLPAFE